jgi:hypothetical protein
MYCVMMGGGSVLQAGGGVHTGQQGGVEQKWYLFPFLLCSLLFFQHAL